MQIIANRKLAQIPKLLLKSSIFFITILSFLSIYTDNVFALPESMPTYERTWGSTGTGQGQFTSPLGIAISRDDKVYVSENSNHRIQVFDVNGGFLFQIGTGIAGTGNNQFSSPQGLAIDHTNGWLYVADNGTGTVKKLDLNGNYITTFTEPPEAGGNAFWSNVNFLTVDQTNGNLVVSIPGEGRVDTVTSNGAWIWSTAVGEANSARGVGILGSEVFVVGQNQNRINIFDKNTGIFTRSIASGQISNPRGLAIDYEGYIYVADMGNARIQKFSQSGANLAQFGSIGTGQGQFTSVYNVMFDPDGYAMFTTENGGNRVQKFTYIQLPITNQLAYSQPIPQPQQCGESLTGVPEFFKIERDGTKATLFFTPILNVSEYVVAYGDADSTDDYGATFNVGWTNGVQQYTVDKLDPNKKYSFKLAGKSGCALGTWSHTLRSYATRKLADTGTPVLPITLFSSVMSLAGFSLYRITKNR